MITKNKPLKLVSSTRMIKCRTDMYGQITNRYGFSELTMIGENLKYLIIDGQEEAVVYNKNTKVFFRQDINYNNFFYIGNSSKHKVSALRVLTLFNGKFINSIVNRVSMFIKAENPVYVNDVRVLANENKNGKNLHIYIKSLENFIAGKALYVNSMKFDYGISNVLYFTYLKAFEKAEHSYRHVYKNRMFYDSEKEKYISLTDRLMLYNIINNSLMSDVRSDELLYVRNQRYFRKRGDYSAENIDTTQVRISEYKNPLMPGQLLNRVININKHIVEGFEKKYKIRLRRNAEIIKVTDVAEKTVTAEKLMIKYISIIYSRLRSILWHTENSQIYFMKNISRYRKNIQTYFSGDISEYMENKWKCPSNSMSKHKKNIYGYPSGNISKYTENKWEYPPDSMLEHNMLKHIKNTHKYPSGNILKYTENIWKYQPYNILKHTKDIHEYLSGNTTKNIENIWKYSSYNMLVHIKNIYGYLSGNITKDMKNIWKYPPYNILKHIKNIHDYLSDNILKDKENTWEYRSGGVLKHIKNIHEYKSGNMSEDAKNIWEYKSGEILKHKKNIHKYKSGNISEDTENIWKYKPGNIFKHIKNIHEYKSGNISRHTENTHKYLSDNIWKHKENMQIYSTDSILSHAKYVRVYSAGSMLSHMKNIYLHPADSILRNTKTIQMYLKGNILSDAGNIKGYSLVNSSVYSKESILRNVENIKGCSLGNSLGESLTYSAGSKSGYTENISKTTQNVQEYYKKIKTKNVLNENRSDVSREKLVYTGQNGYKEIRAEQKALNMENIQNINDVQNIKGIQAIEGIQTTDGLQAIQKNVINRTENIEDILLKQEKIEEINKMIDVRVQSQVKNISRQVYEAIERRLKGEKRRRGF